MSYLQCMNKGEGGGGGGVKMEVRERETGEEAHT